MNMNKPIVAPSILSADFTDLQGALAMIEKSQADWVHLDVMDGHFVPPISFGIKMVSDFRKRCRLPLDVHLMVEQPERMVVDFAEAGADLITFHAEACVHMHRTVEAIHSSGKSAGISIVPSTPISSVVEILPFVDLVLVMTVNPGYGGQKLLEFCLRKVQQLQDLRKSMKLSFKISIDGGVSAKTLPLIVPVRPDVLVMGSAFFESPDPVALVQNVQAAFATSAVC